MVLENWLVAKSMHLQLCTVRCAQSQIPSSFHLWQNNTGKTREGLGSLCMSSWLSPFSVYFLEIPDVPPWLCNTLPHKQLWKLPQQLPGMDDLVLALV